MGFVVTIKATSANASTKSYKTVIGTRIEAYLGLVASLKANTTKLSGLLAATEAYTELHDTRDISISNRTRSRDELARMQRIDDYLTMIAEPEEAHTEAGIYKWKLGMIAELDANSENLDQQYDSLIKKAHAYKDEKPSTWPRPRSLPRVRSTGTPPSRPTMSSWYSATAACTARWTLLLS